MFNSAWIYRSWKKITLQTWPSPNTQGKIWVKSASVRFVTNFFSIYVKM